MTHIAAGQRGSDMSTDHDTWNLGAQISQTIIQGSGSGVHMTALNTEHAKDVGATRQVCTTPRGMDSELQAAKVPGQRPVFNGGHTHAHNGQYLP